MRTKQDLLCHYSAQPLENIISVSQPETPVFLPKPKGFWVSVDSEKYNWRWWCRQESYELGCLKYRTQIFLKPDNNILRITTSGDLLSFTKEFQLRRLGFELDWRTIAQRYDGLIISPYLWECRLEVMWYYGWDCASGCIWNADAIAGFRLLENKMGHKKTKKEKKEYVRTIQNNLV